jgi:stage V sporulation protein R
MTITINSGDDWTFEKLEHIYAEIESIAREVMGIDTKKDIYPNQIEIVSFDQMLDAYSRHGMPIGYDHWTIGEQFVKQSLAYKHRRMGLAFEIVLNSSPCINYLMESNTMPMQALVMAHAGIGHNYVFKNNYLFKEWTDADGIIDYLVFAQKYVRQCEEQYGQKEVEKVLDAAHALQYHGIDKYKRPSKLSAAQEDARREEREKYLQSQLNEIWNSIPKRKTGETEAPKKFVKEPQENILYFLEKHAPRLETWQREILRIVRKISQYFYPQIQTKVLNEGFATYTHYTIINEMYNRGLMSAGAMQEFQHSHTSVIMQPDHDSVWYSGSLNPYAIGFAIYRDIERISLNPTEEDRQWFRNQDWVGNGKPYQNARYACENFKDDSFILQYLSPKVMRDLKLFSVHDDDEEEYIEISGIHNEYGYKEIRSKLAKTYDINQMIPNIQVVDVDIWDTRTIQLEHVVQDRKMLDETNVEKTLACLAFLWGYPVVLSGIDAQTREILVEWDSEPEQDKTVDFELGDLAI